MGPWLNSDPASDWADDAEALAGRNKVLREENARLRARAGLAEDVGRSLAIALSSWCNVPSDVLLLRHTRQVARACEVDLDVAPTGEKGGLP